MKKWAFAITVAFFAIVSVAAGAVALTDNSGDDGAGQRFASDADDRGESDGGGTSVAPVCAPEVPDCDDTIVDPSGDGEGPDEPVSDETPVTIIDGQDPNECSLVHNIEACEKNAVALATDDLAARLGSSDGITLQGVGFIEWPDACLGVSQPDVACAEVITPGFRVLLEVNGQLYEYHTDTGSRALLVE